MSMRYKIGQVTYCEYNYGSILQTYAAQQLFEQFGVETVLIVPKRTGIHRYLHILEDRWSGYRKYILYPRYIGKFRSMRAGSRKKVLSVNVRGSLEKNKRFIEAEIRSISIEHRRLRSVAQSDQYAAFISGSDQIWNADWLTLRKDYFLRFSPKRKRIAFAPSFGKAEIAQYNKKAYRKYISEYRLLSVREKSGVRLIRDLTGREASLVLDPTLLLTCSKWCERKAGKTEVVPPAGRYAFVYFIDAPSDAALHFMRELIAQGVEILVFGIDHVDFSQAGNCRFTDGSPWDYIHLLEHAHIILTDSFHGAALSINFEKSFYVFKRRYSHGIDQSERVLSLLELCDLGGRFVEDRAPHRAEVIAYDRVREKLAVYRRESFAYVDQILDCIRSEA